MFTIKQVISDGTEHVHAAKGTVTRAPANNVGGMDFPPSIHFTTPDGALSTIDSGMIYVVNEQGTTVARYDLGPERLTGPGVSHQRT